MPWTPEKFFNNLKQKPDNHPEKKGFIDQQLDYINEINSLLEDQKDKLATTQDESERQLINEKISELVSAKENMASEIKKIQ